MKKMYLLYSKRFANCPQLVGNSQKINFQQVVGNCICVKDKDNVLAQYALESSSQPIGVAEFQLTKFIPDEFKSSLPSIEDIKLELK